MGAMARRCGSVMSPSSTDFQSCSMGEPFIRVASQPGAEATGPFDVLLTPELVQQRVVLDGQ